MLTLVVAVLFVFGYSDVCCFNWLGWVGGLVLISLVFCWVACFRVSGVWGLVR